MNTRLAVATRSTRRFLRASAIAFGVATLGAGTSGCKGFAQLLSAGGDDDVEYLDPVYTEDETGDVRDIADGDAKFPLKHGTEVPDVDGRTTVLSPTMHGIRVVVTELRVEGSCDDEDEGEFYLDFGVGRRLIGRRSSSEPLDIREGDTMTVHASRVFFAEPSQPFTVHASLSEEDDFLKFGDDDVGAFRNEYRASSVTKEVSWHEVRVGSGTCSIWLTYGLALVQ